MKYPTDADIARAEVYREGIEALAEYVAECVHTRPGACDESFGGGRVRRLPKTLTNSRTPTKLPPGPGHRLIVRQDGETYKRVSCGRCAGTGWDEVFDRPCGRCKPLPDGTRGTTLVLITTR